MIRIDRKIARHVDAVLAAGFTVYALPQVGARPAGFVCVCLTEDGPWAHIQKPAMALDPASLDVPIKPNKDYGSSVLVDHDGTPEDAVVALTKACTTEMVAVRFMPARLGQPFVPNYGRKTIEGWPGRQFEKLGQRGTNWEVLTLAGRLEVGDRFDSKLEDGRDLGILTVTDRIFNREVVIVRTKELDQSLEIRENTFLTLVEGVS